MYFPEAEGEPGAVDAGLAGAGLVLPLLLEQAARTRAAATPPAPRRKRRRPASACPEARSSSVSPAPAACISGRVARCASSMSLVRRVSSASPMAGSHVRSTVTGRHLR